MNPKRSDSKTCSPVSARRLAPSAALGTTLLALCACAATPVSSWKAPYATPFPLKGESVAAVVMATDETTRRAGEDALARQLSRSGVQGIPMHLLLHDAVVDEAKARAAAEQAHVVGVVVMQPAHPDEESSSSPVTHSGGFWEGYYGTRWVAPWGAGFVSGGQFRTDSIVAVETRVYDLRQNRLLWSGQSNTANPASLNRLIEDTAKQVTKDLSRAGLIANRD